MYLILHVHVLLCIADVLRQKSKLPGLSRPKFQNTCTAEKRLLTFEG